MAKSPLLVTHSTMDTQGTYTSVCILIFIFFISALTCACSTLISSLDQPFILSGLSVNASKPSRI